MSDLQITSITVEDGPLLAKNNMTAFYGQTWWRLLWKDTPLDDIINSCGKRFGTRMLSNRETRRFQAVRDPSTNEILGYARWILPESHKDAWLAAQLPDVSLEERQRFQEMHDSAEWNPRDDMDALDEWRLQTQPTLLPKEPYIKLDYLCARPSHHRRGIGSTLLKSGMEQADELGLIIYVVAIGRHAVNLYKKHGFECLAEHSESLKPWGSEDLYEESLLIRHPVSAEPK